ncbi:hypothetical protein LMCDFJHI_03896 [Aeromonas salmonicida]
MADTDQERTEQPTGKRLQQAREKGQIARSKELGTASVLLAAVFGLLMVKESLASAMVKILTIGFTLDRDQAFDPNAMGAMLPALLRELVYPLGLDHPLLCSHPHSGHRCTLPDLEPHPPAQDDQAGSERRIQGQRR